MERKMLGVFGILFAVVILATPVVSAETYGDGLTVETFTVIPSPGTNTISFVEELVPGSPMYIQDGTVRIGRGALRKFSYDGPLGTGELFVKTLHSKYTVSGLYEFPPSSGNYIDETGKGSGLYHYTLVVDGPYGTGTLKGIVKLELEWDYSIMFYEAHEKGKLVPVEGDLNLKWVEIEGLDVFVFHWWTTTTVVS